MAKDRVFSMKPKTVAEKITPEIDFGNDLATSETIASAVIVITDLSDGSDKSGTMLDGNPVIDGELVSHKIKADAVNKIKSQKHIILINASKAYSSVQLEIKREIWELL